MNKKIAKGLGAGYQPIGAMLCTKKIFETIRTGSGLFQHGHTYIGHPVACAAALAVVRSILNRDLLKSINRRSEDLFKKLRDQFTDHQYIGDIRGKGLFIGLEIVKNRSQKKPFDPSAKVSAKIKHAAFQAGLICYPSNGTRDGKYGDHILLAPPFIINENHISEMVDKLSIAINTI